MIATAGLELDLDDHIHRQLSNEFPTIESYTRSTKRPQCDDARDRALAALDRYVLANVAPPLQSGLLLCNAALSATILPTGCPGVDRVLSKGLRCGHLTELCGPLNSGKTTLCLLSALTTSMSGYRVEWMDACNGFAARRLHHLFASRPEAAQPNPQERFIAATKLIQVRKGFQAQQVLDHMDALHKQLEEEGTQEVPVKLVVIDPFASVLVHLLGKEARSQGHSMMAALARQCKAMADRFQLVVLVTQHTIGSSPARPALGDAWVFQPHCRVELSDGTQDGRPQGSLRRARLTGSQIRSCDVSCNFDLAAPMSEAAI